MAVPSAKDLAKKREALEGFQKCLDSEGRVLEKKMVSMLRSAIRQTWMRAPNKLAKLELSRTGDFDETTATKWLYKCEMCGTMKKQADIEVDHIHGNHSFKEVDSFRDYFDNILNVPISGLQILCKEPCHGNKTYSEKHNCTWDEADIERKVIAAMKGVNAKKQKRYLKYMGFTEEEISNPAKRRECYRSLINESRE